MKIFSHQINWCIQLESNQWPSVFQTDALTNWATDAKLERMPEVESGPYRWQRYMLTVKHHTRTFGVPTGDRTRFFRLKVWCPNLIDDRDKFWSLGQDLNLWPSDYRSLALPTELPKEKTLVEILRENFNWCFPFDGAIITQLIHHVNNFFHIS